VGFNPRAAWYWARPVASATLESGALADSTVADATGKSGLRYRGLKPTAKFTASLRDRNQRRAARKFWVM